MKKFFALFFCCFIIITLASCSSGVSDVYDPRINSAAERQSSPGSDNSIKPEDSLVKNGFYDYKGVSFKVPEGYELKTFTESSASFSDKSGSTNFVYDKRKTSFTAKDLTENAINNLYRNYFPDSSVQNYKTILVGSAQGVCFEYGPDKNDSAKDFLICQSSVVYNKNLYSFIFYSNSSNQSNVQKNMANLIETVKLS